MSCGRTGIAPAGAVHAPSKAIDAIVAIAELQALTPSELLSSAPPRCAVFIAAGEGAQTLDRVARSC